MLASICTLALFFETIQTGSFQCKLNGENVWAFGHHLCPNLSTLEHHALGSEVITLSLETSVPMVSFKVLEGLSGGHSAVMVEGSSLLLPTESSHYPSRILFSLLSTYPTLHYLEL